MIISIDLPNSTVPVSSRMAFNNAICEFKKKHNIKLKEIFSKSYPQLDLRRKFFSDPSIIAYLSRSSNIVEFTEYHPNFDVKRENKLFNDYFEAKIYKLAQENVSTMFPYRGKVLEDSFYKSGTTKGKKISELLFKGITKRTDIVIDEDHDIYQIREELLEYQHIKKGPTRFVLSPNCKDLHATTLVSILDPTSDRILASIFINSFNDSSYTREMNRRFILQGKEVNKFLSRNNSEIKNVYLSMAKKIEDNFQGGKGYLSGKQYYLLLRDFNDMSDKLENGEIDVIHNAYKIGENEYSYAVRDYRPVPFIDSSHSLQMEKDDENCYLYSCNFLQAITNLLEANESANRVYQFALDLNDSNNLEKSKEAEDALTQIFKEKLKEYLPYYNKDGTKKTSQELKDYHLKQRWDVGSKGMQDQEYLQSVGFFSA